MLNLRCDGAHVGVLGATSFVGRCLLDRLVVSKFVVTAFSRSEKFSDSDQLQWKKLEAFDGIQHKIPYWVCLAPIAVLPDYFPLLEASDVERIVVVSSTSRFTKQNSSDVNEQILAASLAKAEARVQSWAEERGVEWVILRPTLIYGLGKDKNISEIANFIRRFGCFPMLGKGDGLRQPIHADDVANACLLALNSSISGSYNISGDEVVTYSEMVRRIFSVMGKRPRLFSIPLWMFSVAVSMLRILPRYRKWSSAMAERMNSDMVFGHDDAKRDFGFAPRRFALALEDLPK